MEQRVSLITLGVADLQRSREFYERLGWRRSMAEAEGVVFFQAGGMALARALFADRAGERCEDFSRGFRLQRNSSRIQYSES